MTTTGDGPTPSRRPTAAGGTRYRHTANNHPQTTHQTIPPPSASPMRSWARPGCCPGPARPASSTPATPCTSTKAGCGTPRHLPRGRLGQLHGADRGWRRAAERCRRLVAIQGSRVAVNPGSGVCVSGGGYTEALPHSVRVGRVTYRVEGTCTLKKLSMSLICWYQAVVQAPWALQAPPTVVPTTFTYAVLPSCWIQGPPLSPSWAIT